MTVRDARLPVVLIALALTALTVWSLRYFGRYQPFAELTRQGLPNRLDRIGLEVRDATAVGRVEGKRRWRVACRVITLSRDRRQVAVDGLQDGTLYDEEQRAVVSVSAGHAAYAALGEVFGESTPALGTLHLSGGIQASVLKSPKFTLLSDSLTWDALRGQVECPGVVTARYPGGTATGSDVTVDTHTGDLSLTRLHGVFRVPAEVQMLFRSSPARSALLLGGSLSLLGTAGAAPAPSSAPQYVTYDAGFSRWLNAPRTVEMSQGVTFSQDDAFLKTNAAIVNLDDQQRALNAKSQSPVHLYNAQDDLTGRQGFIDFTRHLATLNNDITLIVKPGLKDAAASPGSLRTRFKDPATLTCAELTYDYRHKIAHIPGALTVHSAGRVLTADSGEYDAATEIVTLVGHVHGTSGDNVIDAPKVEINVKEGQESVTIKAPTHGTFRVKDDDTASPAVAPELPSASQTLGPPPTNSDAPQAPASP